MIIVRLPNSTRLISFGLFFFCMLAYLANGDFLIGNDARGNLYQVASLVDHGSFTVSPGDYPQAFGWALRTPDGLVNVKFTREMYRRGLLVPVQHGYYLSATTREGQYVSAYGIGVALTAAPVLALLRIAGGPLHESPALLWFGGKFAASLMVAASVVLVFLTALRLSDPGRAAVVAFVYGLCSGAWSTASQALWQHGPNMLFLALGCYFLLRLDSYPRSAALCGLMFGMAVLCRPTSIMVVGCVGIWLLLNNRRWFVQYCIAGLPLALLLLTFNYYYLGGPFQFAQLTEAENLVAPAAGALSLWQTPLTEGLTGILFSPSRGLLIYSPVFALSFAGAWVAWRDQRYRVLLPLSVAVLLIFLVNARWFNWWGGWSFGYRLLVDTAPLLALLMVPALSRIRLHSWQTGVFILAMVWSVAVQVTGAWVYNVAGWNNRQVIDVTSGEPVHANVDLPAFRDRLWSWHDNQLRYYITNWTEARRLKRHYMLTELQSGS